MEKHIDTELEENILACIPHRRPFLFVDGLIHVDGTTCKGYYTFRDDEVFFPAHFPGNPITPGVILIECMAQIGLIPLGIYINEVTPETIGQFDIFFVSSNVNYSRPVKPGDTVYVSSEMMYYRFKKLMCKVEMTNEEGAVICKGELSGIFRKKDA